MLLLHGALTMGCFMFSAGYFLDELMERFGNDRPLNLARMWKGVAFGMMGVVLLHSLVRNLENMHNG